ncbi:MAG: 6-phosphogluconolactonase [Puniceicoccaceae bacterium]
MQTRFGTLYISTARGLYAHLASQMLELGRLAYPDALVALSGGTSPEKFYRWAVSEEAFPSPTLPQLLWTTSDERWVPLESGDSNFGLASRLLLDPLQVPATHRVPWTTHGDPEAAACEMDGFLRGRLRDGIAIDLCLLGMGADGHTASLFPQSPLLDLPDSATPYCAAVEVPGIGTRLTYTTKALAASSLVIVLVQGEAKAETLRSLFHEDLPTAQQPIRSLASIADKVLWLIDHEAAKSL